MPPPLPDRYSLEVRLGRDNDTEEWLATDLDLDRPVLVRVLGPDTSEERRLQFIDSVRQAAAVEHTHMASIYMAEQIPDGAYCVSEWGGGVTLADRLASDDTVPVEDFLANSTGLAEALAALHAEGILHGSLDPSAIFYSYAHPAKIGAFGRPHRTSTAASDVRALAVTLETAVTGRPPGPVPPSQIVDGLSVDVDEALLAARNGALDAAGLAVALKGVPEQGQPTPAAGWTWRWTLPAILLMAVAVLLMIIGATVEAGPLSPVFFPARPVATTATTVPATISTTVPGESAVAAPGSVSVNDITVYDPFGDGAEQFGRLFSAENAIDGDRSTAWQSERYLDPLFRIKPGVGLAISVSGTPGEMELLDTTPESGYSIYWASRIPDDFAVWERLASGIATAPRITVSVPERRNGVWLLWLTDVPEHDDGFYGGVAEVRFRP